MCALSFRAPLENADSRLVETDRSDPRPICGRLIVVAGQFRRGHQDDLSCTPVGKHSRLLLSSTLLTFGWRSSLATVTSVDPREALLDAGERLIATRGIDVPLRDIAKAAGNRNNSAVQYFFGSRAGLIEAILERRTSALEASRMSMLADHEASGSGNDVRTLLRMLVQPMLDIPAQGQGTHYCRFLDVVRAHPAVAGSAKFDTNERAAVRIIVTRLDTALGDLEPARRRLRLRSLATAMFGMIADHEAALEAGTVLPSAHDEILDMLTGVLTCQSDRARI